MIKRPAFFIYLLMLTLPLFTGVIPAVADPGLIVGGAVIGKEVYCGSYSHVMTVGLDVKDAAADVTVSVEGLGQKNDGVFQGLPPAIDTSPYTARGFITLDKTSFYLEPGEFENVNVTINVPAGVGDGGRYAAIRVYAAPAGGEGVKSTTGFTVPVLLTVQGSDLIHTGRITGLAASAVYPDEPCRILTTFKNTGNHHYKVKGEVTVCGADDRELAVIDIPLTPSAIIPTMSVALGADFLPAGGLVPGSYKARSRIMLEDGTVLDQAAHEFMIVPRPAGGYSKTTSGEKEAKDFTVLPSVTFIDIRDHWAQKDIEVMAGLGVVRDIGGGRFNPDGKVSRAQFAAFLTCSLGIEETEPGTPRFKDVRSGAWYYRVIGAASKAGLIKGYPDGTCRPDAEITREEIAAVIKRVMDENGTKKGTAVSGNILAQFLDEGNISSWAREAAALMVQSGVIVGRSTGRFAPQDSATRSEAIVILKRLLVGMGKLIG